MAAAVVAFVFSSSAFATIARKTSSFSLFVLPSPKASSFVISTFTLSIAAFNSAFTVLISFLYPVAGAASLNPLSPCPGIAFPLRESWFLFSFSSFLSADAFGILSRTKALFFNELVEKSTSFCVALSFDKRAWALASSAFATSMAEAVFSVRPAFSRAASIRAIAASNLLVSAFEAGARASSAFGVSVGAVGCVAAGAGVDGCSAVGVAVPVEARGMVESAWLLSSGTVCESDAVFGVTWASAWTVAAPPNIM